MEALNSNVTACLVTRGDVDLSPILATLIFEEVVIWDNSKQPDWKCAGRYWAALKASNDTVYFQDDDTIVPAETQRALVRDFERLDVECVANWGHGENPDGYDDLPLVCGGGIVSRRAAWDAIARYGQHFHIDEGFMYEADFVVGVLYNEWEHVDHPWEIRDVAYNGRRLADEPWQKGLKFNITKRARMVRDGEA